MERHQNNQLNLFYTSRINSTMPSEFSDFVSIDSAIINEPSSKKSRTIRSTLSSFEGSNRTNFPTPPPELSIDCYQASNSPKEHTSLDTDSFYSTILSYIGEQDFDSNNVPEYKPQDSYARLDYSATSPEFSDISTDSGASFQDNSFQPEDADWDTFSVTEVLSRPPPPPYRSPPHYFSAHHNICESFETDQCNTWRNNEALVFQPGSMDQNWMTPPYPESPQTNEVHQYHPKEQSRDPFRNYVGDRRLREAVAAQHDYQYGELTPPIDVTADRSAPRAVFPAPVVEQPAISRWATPMLSLPSKEEGHAAMVHGRIPAESSSSQRRSGVAGEDVYVPADPEQWDAEAITRWLQWMEHKFAISPVNRELLPGNGVELCRLTKHDLLRITGDSQAAEILSTYIAHIKQDSFRNSTPGSSSSSEAGSDPNSRLSPKDLIIKTFSRKSEDSTPTPGGQIQMWQFLLDLLIRNETNLVEWIGDCGKFRLVDPEEVARMWGQRKGKPNMNYDKLSRGLRYYYDKGIMDKKALEKYSYRFIYEGLVKAVQNSGISDTYFIQPGYMNGKDFACVKNFSLTSKR